MRTSSTATTFASSYSGSEIRDFKVLTARHGCWSQPRQSGSFDEHKHGGRAYSSQAVVADHLVGGVAAVSVRLGHQDGAPGLLGWALTSGARGHRGGGHFWVTHLFCQQLVQQRGGLPSKHGAHNEVQVARLPVVFRNRQLSAWEGGSKQGVSHRCVLWRHSRPRTSVGVERVPHCGMLRMPAPSWRAVRGAGGGAQSHAVLWLRQETAPVDARR